MTTEDLLLEFMAKVNNALSLEDDALRLRAVRQAKHWAELEYGALHGCAPSAGAQSDRSPILDDVTIDRIADKVALALRARSLARAADTFSALGQAVKGFEKAAAEAFGHSPG